MQQVNKFRLNCCQLTAEEKRGERNTGNRTGRGGLGWGEVAVFPKEMETLFQLATAIWGASSHQLEIIYEYGNQNLWVFQPGKQVLSRTLLPNFLSTEKC